MKIFDACLLRLKQATQLPSDQEVAELLGMTKAALSDRKRRDSFPVEKVRALAQQRPELRIDVHYVLTGITTEAQARLDAKQGRIERAVDADMDIEHIRAMERQVTSASPERLMTLGAMLGDMRTEEFDAIYTLAETITEMRSALEKHGRASAARKAVQGGNSVHIGGAVGSGSTVFSGTQQQGTIRGKRPAGKPT